jgi:hypothetical protein
MQTLAVYLGHVVVARAAVDRLKSLIMWEVFHTIEVDVAAYTFQISMDRPGKSIRIHVKRDLAAVPLGGQLLILMTCQAVIC